MSNRVLLTADEAISLLPDGPTVHNFKGGGMVLMGADWDRESAIDAIRSAYAVELGGGASYSMGHPLAVWASERRVSFFEANMEKVAALEAARAVPRG